MNDAPHTQRRFGRAIRQEWLLEEGMTFLNHGSFGATPRRVLACQTRWQERLERQPVRFFVEELAPALRDAAEDLAQLLGARGQDLAFVENATDGVNAVLRSLELEPGDELLVTCHVYPAVRNAVEFVCKRSGAVAVPVEVPFPTEGPSEFLQRIEDALTERTRLVIIDHVTSATALVLPVADVVASAQQRGIPVLVDGAHAPGMVQLELQELGADWYTGNCHKWLCSPKGCAFLWANPESPRSRESLHPTVISLGYGDGFPAEFDYVGTRDSSAWLAVTEALAFHRELGAQRVRDHNHQLVLEGGRILREAWGVEVKTPESMIGSILTLPCPLDLPPTDDAARGIRNRLWLEHRIEVQSVAFAEALWIRISAQVYNEPDDYRALAAALL